jgi:hypothetical protein
MNTYHAAHWSSSLSPNDERYKGHNSLFDKLHNPIRTQQDGLVQRCECDDNNGVKRWYDDRSSIYHRDRKREMR